MRIREVFFRDFRSFRGKQRISFVDPLTDAVQPLSVLAGTNGTGKTTVFDTIEALLAFALEPDNPGDLISEAWETGLVGIQVELSPRELGGIWNHDLGVSILAGRQDPDGGPEEDWSRAFCHLLRPGGGMYVSDAPFVFELRKSILLMQQGMAEPYGGLVYFPHDRRLKVSKAGAIEPPPEERRWRFRFSSEDRWQGSLEQLWVWQNYLDLEQGSSERKNLRPFVEAVETILGEERRITVKEGRAWAPPPWSAGQNAGEWVRLDQLPSGEQQCLLLFGELARRRPNGAVIAIDEIENSLHPTLQRRVVHQLRRFARDWDSQVILATHSLEVLRAAHEIERVNLDHLDEVHESLSETL